MTRHIVLYDEECSFCVSQMKLLSGLDWFHTLTMIPLSDPRAAQAAPQLRREELLEAIHCITPQGRIHRAARAFRFLGVRLPLLAPLALILWMPFAIGIAEVVYRWVSRHRQLLSGLFGCKSGCAVLRAGKREQDELV